MRKKDKKSKTVTRKKKEIKKTKKRAEPSYNEEDDEADFEQRMAQQAKDGDKKGGGKRTCLDLSIFDKEVEWFKAQVDERYKMNIIPFRVSEERYKDLLQQAGPPINRKIGKLESSLIVPVHGYIGKNNETVLCLYNAFNENCPLCEKSFKLRQEDYNKNEAAIKDLNVSWKCYYNIRIKGKKENTSMGNDLW